MNKYQEAFEIVKNAKVSYETIDELIVLKELVEKATPKKVREITNERQLKKGYRHYCPVCNDAVGYLEPNFPKPILYEKACGYCHICGQALDWGE